MVLLIYMAAGLVMKYQAIDMEANISLPRINLSCGSAVSHMQELEPSMSYQNPYRLPDSELVCSQLFQVAALWSQTVHTGFFCWGNFFGRANVLLGGSGGMQLP